MSNKSILSSPVPEQEAFESLRKMNREKEKTFVRPKAPRRSFHKRRHSSVTRNDIRIYHDMTSIGFGDEGEVFRAVNEQGVVVALKKIVVDHSSGLWNKFREYHYGSHLNHYAIINYLNYVPVSKYELYLEMELCDISLFTLFKEEPIPYDMACKYFLDLVLATEYIHANGLVHLDIKPSNILLSGTDRSSCKLGDLGLMIMLNEWGIYVTHGGSGHYMAPECIDDCDTISPAVDVYSLGLLMIQLLLDLDISNWNKNTSEIPWEEMEQDFQSLLQTMIAQDPKERPSCFEILQGFGKIRNVADNYSISIPSTPSVLCEPIPAFANEDFADYFTQMPSPKSSRSAQKKSSEFKKPSKVKPTNRILFMDT
eukprot:TRINITY_DN2084_c0_g1_i3.p1 TRINITY_DN2084_c0_g1~~TRINITY_DN2084_c0_g1_i3.p1  ORF type:complete len:369 (+),score=66.88 TRINITY_DN2084_c0_g1_i3:1152-2258(+)